MGAYVDGVPEEFAVALKAEPHVLSACERAAGSYRNGLLALVHEAREGDRRDQPITLVMKTLVQHGSP